MGLISKSGRSGKVVGLGAVAGVILGAGSHVMADGQINAGVIVLNPSATGALSFSGIGTKPKIDISLSGGGKGDVVVNSNGSNAFTWTGNPVVNIANLYLGSNQANAAAVLPTGSNLHLNSPAVVDPIATATGGSVPTKPTILGVMESNGHWTPGYYPNGLPSGAVLDSGFYYVDGGISGSVIATAGAFIFVHSGDLLLHGNDVFDINRITAANDPTDFAAYSTWTSHEISLWVYQGNVSMSATADMTNDGVLYLTSQAPTGGNVAISGPTVTSLGSQLICDTLNIGGNSSINVFYDGINPVGVPEAASSGVLGLGVIGLMMRRALRRR